MFPPFLKGKFHNSQLKNNKSEVLFAQNQACANLVTSDAKFYKIQ